MKRFPPASFKEDSLGLRAKGAPGLGGSPNLSTLQKMLVVRGILFIPDFGNLASDDPASVCGNNSSNVTPVQKVLGAKKTPKGNDTQRNLAKKGPKTMERTKKNHEIPLGVFSFGCFSGSLYTFPQR